MVTILINNSRNETDLLEGQAGPHEWLHQKEHPSVLEQTLRRSVLVADHERTHHLVNMSERRVLQAQVDQVCGEEAHCLRRVNHEVHLSVGEWLN